MQPLQKKMPSFSSDFCPVTDQVRPPSPIFANSLLSTQSPTDCRDRWHLDLSANAPSSSSSSSSSSVSQQRKDDHDDPFKKPKSLFKRSKVLDGSFRIVNLSRRPVPDASPASCNDSHLSKVRNSTPLTADGTIFDCCSPPSSIVSPICSDNRIERDCDSAGCSQSKRRKTLPYSKLTKGEFTQNTNRSQLCKELVVAHSYIPNLRDKRPNPLGIYPRRPINNRTKDLIISHSTTFFSTNALLSPIIKCISEKMSPRKRPTNLTSGSSISQSKKLNIDSSNESEISKNTSSSTVGSTFSGVILILIAFLSCLSLLYYLYTKVPHLSDEELLLVKFPRSIEDAKDLGKVLSAYKDDHFDVIVLGFFAVYNFLQTFAIPGSIFLSILSGFLFPFPLACFLVSLCSALGASFCYLLSSVVGKPIMNRYFKCRVEEWRSTVERQRQNLLSYIIFLRITPFLPNWFINITSPIIGVPLIYFFIGTFIGVAPPSFVYISAGQTLHQLTSTSSILTWYQIAMLGLVALISLLPVLLKDTLKKKFS